MTYFQWLEQYKEYIMTKKQEPKTEKILKTKSYDVTTVKGVIHHFNATGHDDLNAQIIKTLYADGLSFPTGILPGGIQEVGQ